MSAKRIAIAAVVGAAYVAFTLAFAPISYGALQFRVSEALAVLPYMFPVSVWGLFVGCFLANLLGGAFLLDIIFGPIATLIAAYITSKIRNRWVAPLPSVLVNALVVGAVLAYSGAPGAFWQAFPVIALQVGVGQLGVCYGLGIPLLFAMDKLMLNGLSGLASERRKP